MICKSYQDLSHQEKVRLIGEVCHALQVDEEAFMNAHLLVKMAKDRGVFQGVHVATETDFRAPLQENY